MRATKAYIASLGTTGLLLACSACLLLVAGTLFAFNAWPGGEIREAVGSLVLGDDEERFELSGPAQVALDAAPAAAAVSSVPVGVGGDAGTFGPAGGAAGGDTPDEDTSGGGSFEDGIDGIDGGPSGPDRPDPIDFDDEIDTGGPTDDIADSTENVTRDLGQTVAGVSPQLSDAVSGAGRTLSDTVRGLPDVTAGKNGVRVGGLKRWR